MQPKNRRRGPAKKAPVPAAARPLNPSVPFAIALVILTLAAYGNSFDSGFVMDTRGVLVSDPRVHAATAENLGLILSHTYWWPNGETGLYRPLTTLSWLFNYAILGNGERPAGYHVIDLALHAGNALMVFALALRFLRRHWPAFFLAAIWAVHPVLTESVTNIAGRPDLLAAGATLGSLLTYLKSAEAEGPPRYAWMAALALVTAAGVFAKESAAVIPGAIVLCEFVCRTAGQAVRRRALAMGLIATLAPIALMLYQRSRVLASTPPYEVAFVDNPIVGADFATGRLTALNAIARYIGLILWPAKLSADYSWSQIPLAKGGPGDWAVAIGVLAIVPVTILLYRRLHRQDGARCGLFFLWLGALALLPVSNLLFPVSMMAERYLYLPTLGVVACLVPAIYALAQRAGEARFGSALLWVVAVVLGARTFARNYDWRDDVSIAEASVETSPGSFKTHDMLANALLAADPTHSNIARVIEESEKSRAILEPLPDRDKPAHPYLFAATCYMARGDRPKAIAVLRRFVAVEAASPGTVNDLRRAYGYLTLASLYLTEGELGQASDAAERSLALNPLDPKIYPQLAEIALKNRRLDDAFVRLTEGEFVTGDAELTQALTDLYRSATDPRSCVLRAGAGGPEINSECGIVHAHVCAASPWVVRTLVSVGRRDDAAEKKRMFVERFGCR